MNADGFAAKQSLIARTFAILEAFPRCGGHAALREMADATGLAKPTVCRILQTLAGLGYVSQAADGRYSLVEKFVELAIGGNDRELVEAAGPVLARLRDRVRENVNLGVLQDNSIMYRISLDCDRALQCRARPLDRDPIFSTALGRVLVAFLNRSRQSFLLTHAPIRQCTAKTQTDSAMLGDILAEIRRDGYAIEREQSEVGMMGVAAPILVGDEAIASISIASPCVRVDDDVLQTQIAEARRAASQVSKILAKSRGARNVAAR